MTSSPLAILYRDDWLIAVDKPAGQLVHPADVPSPDDEVTMKILRDQIGQQIYAIHRIDRPTSGALLFATDQDAAKSMSALFERREVDKTYLAVIDGHPAAVHWICREPLRRSEDAPERPAETKFRVLDRLRHDLTLVKAIPKTGRRHQIRRHLLHAGHPIVGDYRYSGIERSEELGAKLGTGTRMLLQAKKLSFRHPLTSEQVTIEAATDSAIKGLLF